MSLLTRGINKLSQLEIDTNKDWQSREIANLKAIAAGMAHGDVVFRGGSILERLTADAGKGYSFLRSRGPGLSPVWQDIESLVQYMTSEAFRPKHKLLPIQVRSLLRKPPSLFGAKVVFVDSEASGHEGRYAIDGDPQTIWHTEWEGESPKHPHEIQIDLGKEMILRGFTYLPRRDMLNGTIRSFEFYGSRDGKTWGKPLKPGNFKYTLF